MNLAGKKVAFVGNLLYLPRNEARRIAKNAGAVVQTRVGATTEVVVVGLGGWHLNPDSRRDVERRLAEIEPRSPAAITERQFLQVADAAVLEQFQTQYSPSHLARVAGTTVPEVRRWLRRGLIHPARIVNRLPWFDFAALTHARKLVELTSQGVSLSEIKRVTSLVPDGPAVLSRLEALYARPIIRLSDGTATETSGQILMEFDHTGDADTIVELDPEVQPTAADWFVAGVEAEDGGDLVAAEKAYVSALRTGGPDAETCFNLGNVLYGQDRVAEASQRFLQAIEIDGAYIEAWNNLGNALASLDREEDAIRAYERALEIEPHYTDARFNLAETLEELGRREEANRHWFLFLADDSESSAASEIRRRLFQDT